MDPRDRLRNVIDGVSCAACGDRVPSAEVRVLAERDDLAYIEFSCRTCDSVGLAIVVEAGTDGARVLDEGPGSTTDGGHAGRSVAPIRPDDVLDMHLLLSSWRGDLHALVGGRDRGATRESRR
jgi:hypothetical protein